MDTWRHGMRAVVVVVVVDDEEDDEEVVVVAVAIADDSSTITAPISLADAGADNGTADDGASEFLSNDRHADDVRADAATDVSPLWLGTRARGGLGVSCRRGLGELRRGRVRRALRGGRRV